MPETHLHESHPEIVKRLKRAEGHIRKVITMFGEGRTCLELAQQLHAVEKAIGEAKRQLSMTMSIIVSTPRRTGRASRRGRW
jgi:uncharacterized protein